MRRIAALGKTGGTLDYVTAWFIEAGKYVQKGPARIGFVATNSITQGEQVAQLWPVLFERCGLEIAFAHRTFAWGSDARGKAHVHVVIIGLDVRDRQRGEQTPVQLSRHQRRAGRNPARRALALSVRRRRTRRPASGGSEKKAGPSQWDGKVGERHASRLITATTFLMPRGDGPHFLEAEPGAGAFPASLLSVPENIYKEANAGYLALQESIARQH